MTKKVTNMGRPVGNKYKVPKRQWMKWSNHAKQVFNSMMTSMTPANQWMFLHPRALTQCRGHWETTRWNVAWTAADIADGLPVLTGVIIRGVAHIRAPK